MDKVIIVCNSQVVLDSLIEQGLTITAAARKAGIDRELFQSLLRSNRAVTVKTAAKLRRHFGADAITVAPAQGSVTA